MGLRNALKVSGGVSVVVNANASIPSRTPAVLTDGGSGYANTLHSYPTPRRMRRIIKSRLLHLDPCQAFHNLMCWRLKYLGVRKAENVRKWHLADSLSTLARCRLLGAKQTFPQAFNGPVLYVHALVCARLQLVSANGLGRCLKRAEANVPAISVCRVITDHPCPAIPAHTALMTRPARSGKSLSKCYTLFLQRFGEKFRLVCQAVRQNRHAHQRNTKDNNSDDGK
jgi:hypothetical protein